MLPMPSPQDTHVLIVGAGLAGALLATDLARLGYRVSVYERRPDPRVHGFLGGRSINLALSCRGITALRRVGLADKVLADAIPMPGRILHAPEPDAPTHFQPYSRNPHEAINSVSRGKLNITLLEAAAAHESVALHFGQRCERLELTGPGTAARKPAAIFHDESTDERRRVEADVIIGADGAYSAVRAALQTSGPFDYAQTYEQHGYKELTIPPAADIPGFTAPRTAWAEAGYAMDPSGLHIWPRGSAMMIALPNTDRTFTCTLFWPFRGEHSFEAVEAARRSDDDAIRAFFQRHYPDAVPLMPTLVEDFRANPTSPLVTIRCGPWHAPAPHDANVVLVGDAAHAIVPFYGQGMNAAFEDCRILAEMLEASGHDFASVIPRFYQRRKPNADAIADMALDNFIEMRDKVGSRAFLLKKKAENRLHGLLPGVFTPLYNMVSFTDTPYAEAKRRAAAQWRGLALVAAIVLGLVVFAVGWAALETPLGGLVIGALAAVLFFVLVARPHRRGAAGERGEAAE